MNILIVSAVLTYPLHSGGQIRMYNLLKRLSTRHRITLVSFIRSDEERKFTSDFGFCEEVHMVMRGRAWQPGYVARALTGKYPLLLATYENASMKELLTHLIQRRTYDIFHIEPFYVWPSLPKHSIPLVVSEHNIEYDVYGAYARSFSVPILRPLLLKDVEKLKTWERMAWRNANSLTAVSPADAAIMEAYLSHSVEVVSNGVDLAAFPFRLPSRRARHTILFVGNFRWVPNRDAANILIDRIWPGVKKLYPDAQLTVVGRDIPSSLKKRITRQGGKSDENVTDIASCYGEADTLVAPHTISGGTKFKMLEAMATGLPIVTTAQGAFGLRMEAGVHFQKADTPKDFIFKIQELWENPKLADALSLHARRLVEQYYSWDTIAGELEHVWKKTHEHK